MIIKAGFFHVCLELVQPFRQEHIEQGLNFRFVSFFELKSDCEAKVLFGQDMLIIKSMFETDGTKFVNDRKPEDFVVVSISRLS